MSSHLYAVFSFIGFVLCVIPFYWHLQGSSGTLLAFWLLALNVFFCSLEHWHLHVHGLGWPRLPCSVYQRHPVE